MIYGYLRVSTAGQTVENQRFEIRRFCRSRGVRVREWIAETVCRNARFRGEWGAWKSTRTTRI